MRCFLRLLCWTCLMKLWSYLWEPLVSRCKFVKLHWFRCFCGPVPIHADWIPGSQIVTLRCDPLLCDQVTRVLFIFPPLPKIRSNTGGWPSCLSLRLTSTSLISLSHAPDSQNLVLGRVIVTPPLSHQCWVIVLRRTINCLSAMLLQSPLDKKIDNSVKP